ncbi:protein ABHD11 isoform X1 [Gallus gallus]|uniref:protein ABHD11 isoform X1 n=1 Tax=Gallus gallus TaxID=9031 RepID=UPI001F019F11|nr:protein ABHD11 isoform X1 [Gallus gallus]
MPCAGVWAHSHSAAAFTRHHSAPGLSPGVVRYRAGTRGGTARHSTARLPLRPRAPRPQPVSLSHGAACSPPSRPPAARGRTRSAAGRGRRHITPRQRAALPPARRHHAPPPAPGLGPQPPPAARSPLRRDRCAVGPRRDGCPRHAPTPGAAPRPLRQPRQLPDGGQSAGAARRWPGEATGGGRRAPHFTGSPAGVGAVSSARPQVTQCPPAGQVLTMDARNHGSSPHSPLMTYEAMSVDVQHLLAHLGIHKCILVGHSMGGKTAMVLALQRPDLVERLISVDIGPTSTALISEFPAYISAMKSVNIPAGLSRSTARQLADSQLSSTVQDPQLRQFLLTNLVAVEGRYIWRVNLDAISHHFADIMSFPVFHKPYPGPVLFLGGSNSPYISSKDYPEIQRLFPKADVQFIEGAGHIVHQDKFEDFITAVLNFLPPP